MIDPKSITRLPGAILLILVATICAVAVGTVAAVVVAWSEATATIRESFQMVWKWLKDG